MERIRKFLLDLQRCWSAGNSEDLPGFYHPDVVLLPPDLGAPIRGRDAVVASYREFLDAATPLLQLRQEQGLGTLAVTFEQIVSEFGFGEPTPEAIRDFLSCAYHQWRQPPRYVLLLGDT